MITKVVTANDTKLADFFAQFQKGERQTSSQDSMPLIYLEGGKQTEASRIDCFGLTPIRYGTSGLNIEQGTMQTEEMEVEVLRCELGWSAGPAARGPASRRSGW